MFKQNSTCKLIYQLNIYHFQTINFRMIQRNIHFYKNRSLILFGTHTLLQLTTQWMSFLYHFDSDFFKYGVIRWKMMNLLYIWKWNKKVCSLSYMIDNMSTILTNIFNDWVNTWYSVTLDMSGILGMECKEESRV